MNGWWFALAVAWAGPDLRGVVLTPLPPEQVPAGRRVALVIGINDYPGSVHDLSYAVHDAEAVADLLTRRYAFDAVDVLLDGEATKGAVRDALEALARTDEADSVLIFWAGHGVSRVEQDGRTTGFLVPSDGDPSLRFEPSDNLAMAEVRQLLLEEIPARHKLFIADACYAGVLSTRGGGAGADAGSPGLEQLLARPVVQVLTAGRADETVLDGGGTGHSIFTAALLDALETPDDYITASELAATVQRVVREDAFRQGHAQNPDFERLAGTGDFVLIPMGDRSARALRAPARARRPDWGAVVPGLVHPERFAPYSGVAHVEGLMQPLGATAIRLVGPSGVESPAEDAVVLRGAAGASIPLSRWRLDLEGGGAWAPAPEAGARPVAGLGLTTPAWTRNAWNVALQPRVSTGSGDVGDGVGVGVLAGSTGAVRWGIDGRLSWPEAGLGVGVRAGRPELGLVASGIGELAWHPSSPLTWTARPRLGIDLSTRSGVRVVVAGQVGATGVRVVPGQVAWTRNPEALSSIDTTADGSIEVSGPGVSGAPTTGAGWHAAGAPGPSMMVWVSRPWS